MTTTGTEHSLYSAAAEVDHFRGPRNERAFAAFPMLDGEDLVDWANRVDALIDGMPSVARPAAHYLGCAEDCTDIHRAPRDETPWLRDHLHRAVYDAL